MHLDSAYRWARGIEDARIGLAGTTAGFCQYGFYGTDLSNRVVYLGEKGPHGAFNAIPTCRAFRAAVNAADLDYLVTSPFLNFIHPGSPDRLSPRRAGCRGERAVRPIVRSGPVTVWRVRAAGSTPPPAPPRKRAARRRVPAAVGPGQQLARPGDGPPAAVERELLVGVANPRSSAGRRPARRITI